MSASHIEEATLLHPTEIRTHFAKSPSPIAALAADVNGAATVLVASTFTVGVSLDPPLCMFAVQNSSNTWPVLTQADKIGVSILSDQHESVVRQLAGRDVDARLNGVQTRNGAGGSILLESAAATYECSIHDAIPAGDHTIVVLRIHNADSQFGAQPLIFHDSQVRRLTRSDQP